MNFIIFGEIGSGKDTLAEILAEYYNSKIIKLGGRIRHDVDEIYSLLPNNEKINRRELYQKYGQNMRAVFGADIWNIWLYEKIKHRISKDSFIIADARQPNELTYWMEKGFIPIGITAPEHLRWQRVKSRDGFEQSIGSKHETEVNARNIVIKIVSYEAEDKGFVFINDGTITDLRKSVDEMHCKLQKCIA